MVQKPLINVLVNPLCLQTNALNISTDTNAYVKDIVGPFDCIEEDIVTDKLGIQLQVDESCCTQVHKDHLNVYDFTGWVRSLYSIILFSVSLLTLIIRFFLLNSSRPLNIQAATTI